MESITVQLPDDVARQLRDLSSREKRRPEDTARDILRRRLALDRFHELCRQSQKLASAAGYISDDDVLRDIS